MFGMALDYIGLVCLNHLGWSHARRITLYCIYILLPLAQLNIVTSNRVPSCWEVKIRKHCPGNCLIHFVHVAQSRMLLDEAVFAVALNEKAWM